jgi:Family of unknown function (DUF6998)
VNQTVEWKQERLNRVRRLIKQLFGVVAELQEEFAADQRKFTPDGHLVGSIGEVIAAYAFDLKLLRSSNSVHDAETTDGKLVQIKLTGGKRVGLYSEPEHLIVLQLAEMKVKTIYNGPGGAVWKCCRAPQKNGQRFIQITKLREMDRAATPKIKQVREFPL